MPKPSQLVAAIRIMWVLLALGGVMILIPAAVVVLAHGGLSILELAPIVAAVVILALLAFLIRAVSNGRNWARMLYGAITAIAILAIGASFFTGSAMTPIAVSLRTVLIALDALVLYLLFHPASGQWFRSLNVAAPR